MVHVPLLSISFSHLAQETTDFLEFEVETISSIAADSLSCIEAKLKKNCRSPEEENHFSVGSIAKDISIWVG